jgi:hypothetical protein
MKMDLGAIAILITLIGTANGYGGQRNFIPSVERLNCRRLLSGGTGYNGVYFNISSPEFNELEHQGQIDARRFKNCSS